MKFYVYSFLSVIRLLLSYRKSVIFLDKMFEDRLVGCMRH
jgi:hypothetical protein